MKMLYADPKAAAAAVTGGAGVYAGGTALSYNKENYNIDEENRFTRFASARANMCAQVGQYRFDIRGLTNVTVTKTHVFLDTAQLFMCTSAALSCAGRIGMHGSAPPGWLCALYTGNIFIGAMYLTVCLWLGFHAGLRAQCGMVSLLTRKVRLPIPSLQMINGARVFGSGYEKQKAWDILRFPWVPHPFDAPDIPGASSDEEDAEGKGKTGKKKQKKHDGADDKRHGDVAASDAFGSTGRASVPSWIRDEQVTDKGTSNVPRMENAADLGMRYDDPHEAPDHFRLFAEAQKEWFPYETYHRIALLFGACCFFHGICYYCVIYGMSELRGFWIAWALPATFMTGQYYLLQLDIFKSHGQHFLPNFELFGFVAPYFAAAACTCEYGVTYSKAQTSLAWVFAFGALISHMLYALRFFDLMTPDTMSKELEELDGKSWWPRTWPVPLAFVNTLWQITPPRKLKKGQHDLLHEAINLERQNGGICKVRRRRGKDSSPKGKKQKKQMAQSPRALLAQASELEYRFRSSWHQVEGKDQSKLNQIYGRWVVANKEAQGLMKDFGGASDSGSGSDGEGSGPSKGMSSKGEERLVEVADELNNIEEYLQELEQKNKDFGGSETIGKSSGGFGRANSSYNGNGNADIDIGTSSRGLPQTPYWIMRAAVSTHILVWFFIIVCTAAEVVLGPESLFAPPGEPPWIRNQKLRVYQPTKEYLHLSTDPLPSWYRLFYAANITHEPDVSGGGDHGDGGHGSGHRRLDGAEAFNDLFQQLPSLDWLSQEYLKDEDHVKETRPSRTAGMPTVHSTQTSPPPPETTSVPTNGFMTPSLRTLPVDWPPLFEPRHLVCQTRSSGAAITALTPRGFGALLHVTNSTDDLEGRATEPLAAESFALAGISALGPLVGANWGKAGLHLVTKAGHLLHCPGHVPTNGAWPCEAASAPAAPISPGASLRAGALSDHEAGRMLALLFESMPKTVVMYKEHKNGKSWVPAGEVHLPPGCHQPKVGFSGDSLMLVGEDGAVHHRLLQDGVQPSVLPAPSSSATREWHDACAASTMDGGVMRLALSHSGLATGAWRAELVLSASAKPLVNV
jgi:hypothetical protein